MTAPPFEPARAERLTWHVPSCTSIEAFEAMHAPLEAQLTRPRGVCVYRAKRRALHRLDDPSLGPLAVKEIHSGSRLRATAFRWLLAHPGLRELRAASEYQDRGGRSPELLAGASEGSWRSLGRFFLIFRWLDETLDLAAYLRRIAPEPSDELFDRIAQHLVDDARLGLVHGRHALGNLLVLPAPGEPAGIELQTIDFAYAKLGSGLDPQGFVGDVARIAVQLVDLRGIPRERVLDFVRRAADKAWEFPASAQRCRDAIVQRMDARLAELAARPPQEREARRRSAGLGERDDTAGGPPASH